MKTEFKTGDKATIRVCSGDFPVIVRKVKTWPFSGDIAYEVYGDNCSIISTTRKLMKRASDKVKNYSTCHLCETYQDCCFQDCNN